MPANVHGVARLSDDGQTLTITTKAKRTRKVKGQKVVDYKDHVRTYTIQDTRPDPRVASPAFALTNEDGDVYHVSVNEFGPACDCPDGHFRRENDREKCKHVKALQAVGLLPKPAFLPIDDPLPE